MKYTIISQGRGASQLLLLVVVITGLFTLENVCCQSEQSRDTDSVLPYCQRDYQCQTPFETFVKSSSKCSCHPFCKAFQDCCYDVDSFNNELNIVSSSLLGILPSYKDYFECTTDVTSSDRYWMVSRCPPSWPTSQDKCRLTENESQYTVGKLQDLSSIPVVSRTGVTFRNIFCAICHGHELSSVTPWSLTIDCIDIALEVLPPIANLTLEEKLLLLGDICGNLTLVPPSVHPYNLSSVIPCRQPSNTSLFTQGNCSETGLSEECNDIHAPLHVYGNLFKNHYCAKCFYDEIGRNITFFEYCVPTTSDRECYFNETGGLVCTIPEDAPLVPISVTFNFFGRGSGVSISSGSDNLDTVSVECGEGQVFDPTSSLCLQLSCPTGYQLEDEQCVRDDKNVLKNNSCDHFHLKVTLKLQTAVDCSADQDIAQLLGCLPDELVYILIGTNLLNDTDLKYTCESNQHGIFHISINHEISDVQAQQLFWPNFQRVIPLRISSGATCRIIDGMDFLTACASSDVPSECRTSWRNDQMWDMSNFTETVESQVRLRRTLRFFDNGSLTDLFSLQRCLDDFHCPLVTLNASLFLLEGNDSDVLVLKSNRSIRFTSNMYVIDDVEGTITVCNFLDSTGEVEAFFPPFTLAQSILSTVGIVMSIIALLLTLTSYVCLPSLRTRTASILVMILCICLTIAQLCLLFAGIATSSRTLCAILSGVGHFFWLAAFSTSCFFGFALDRTFSLKNQTYRGHRPSNKTLLINISACFLFPTLISGALLVLHLTDHDERYSIYYGNEQACWIGDATTNLLSFGLPVLVSLLINSLLFSRVVYALCAQHRSSRKVRGRQKGGEIREFLIYIKIFVTLSLTWIVGYIASLSNQQFLWYTFIVLTSLQGVFIFLAFTVKSQVLHMWKEKIIKSTALTTNKSSQYDHTASSSL